MRSLIIALVVLPLLLLGSSLAYMARKEKEIRAASQIKVAIPPIGDPPQSDNPKIVAGWRVFTEKGCVYCHGPAGSGGVPNPNAVGRQVPALTKVGAGYTKEELIDKIRKGVQNVSKDSPNGPTPPLFMPPWSLRLTAKELDDVADYLISLTPQEAAESWGD